MSKMSDVLANVPCILYVISSAVLTQVCQWNQLQTDQTYFPPVPDHHGANSTQKLIDQITDWLNDCLFHSILTALCGDCMIWWWLDLRLRLCDGDFPWSSQWFHSSILFHHCNCFRFPWLENRNRQSSEWWRWFFDWDNLMGLCDGLSVVMILVV